MREGFEKQKNLLIALICVASLCIVSNVMVLICSWYYRGFHLMNLFPLLMSIMLYVSVIKHIVKCFFQSKESNIMSMLLRFSATVGTFLIGLGNNTHVVIVALIVAILILVPFMAGDLMNVKRDFIIIIIVMILSIALDLSKIIFIPEAVLTYTVNTLLDKIIYYIFAFNQVLQWGLFGTVYLIRARHYILNASK